MIAARWMIASGATSATSRSAWVRSVRTAHRASAPLGSFAAALRLTGASRSVATTWRPSSVSRLTVADPTRPKPPVTSTVPDITLLTCGYDILFLGEYHAQTPMAGGEKWELVRHEQRRG